VSQSKAEALVERLARMTTPFDGDQLERARRFSARFYGVQPHHVTDEEARDWIESEVITGDMEADDAHALWRMIAEAREIVKIVQAAS
jgi:hypothetical protein